MPEQAIYFDHTVGGKQVKVVKTYDSVYARACFDEMGKDANEFLRKALDLECKYRTDPGTEVTWEDLEEEAREDGNMLSYFVVTSEESGSVTPVYVSPDWPSAEQFAKRLFPT